MTVTIKDLTCTDIETIRTGSPSASGFIDRVGRIEGEIATEKVGVVNIGLGVGDGVLPVGIGVNKESSRHVFFIYIINRFLLI